VLIDLSFIHTVEMSRSFATRPAAALLFLMMGALGTSENCGSPGKDTCAESPDVSEFLQNNVKVAASIEPVEVEDDSDDQPVEPPPIDLLGEDVNMSQPIGGESICGIGEEVTPTTCLTPDSIVASQARATAHMKMGGCCTAWLVKSKTAGQGALMLSTGHCGSKSSADFWFDHVNACPSKGVPAPTKVVCSGKRLSVEASKDEHAIYELSTSCTVVDSITPILLDIGVPDIDEGMYLIGHPRCLPKFLSHKEVHDEGHHCEVRKVQTWGSGSKRISYYCDTSGGNSGSPVFSARTGYAFAIHSHGGCSSNKNSANWGGLLENPGNVAALKQFGIPYVDRKQVNLFQYEDFISVNSCPDHASSATVTGKTEGECKLLCVGSLTCIGFEYSSSKQECIVNYDSTKTPGTCATGSVYYQRTKTLMDPPPAPTPAPTPVPTPAPTPVDDCNKTKTAMEEAVVTIKSVAKDIKDMVDDLKQFG